MTVTIFMVGSGIAERYHQRYFQRVALPGGTELRSVTADYCSFNIAGPKARQVLESLTGESMSNESFPFMRSKKMRIQGVDVFCDPCVVHWRSRLRSVHGPRLINCRCTDYFFVGWCRVRYLRLSAGRGAAVATGLKKGYGSWGARVLSRVLAAGGWP